MIITIISELTNERRKEMGNSKKIVKNAAKTTTTTTVSQCHLPFTIMSSLSFVVIVVVVAIRLKCVTRDCYVCFSRFFNFNFFFLYFFSVSVNFYFVLLSSMWSHWILINVQWVIDEVFFTVLLVDRSTSEVASLKSATGCSIWICTLMPCNMDWFWVVFKSLAIFIFGNWVTHDSLLCFYRLTNTFSINVSFFWGIGKYFMESSQVNETHINWFWFLIMNW